MTASESNSSPDDIDRATMHRIIELTLPDFGVQCARWDAIDGKTWQALGVASVALTLGLALGNPGNGVVSVGIVAYAICAVSSGWAVWARPIRNPVNAAELWGMYWDEPLDKLNRMLVDEIQESAIENAQTLERKAWGLRIALVGMAMCVVAALTASTT